MERYCLLLRESDPRAAEAACASQEHALRAAVRDRGGLVAAVVSDLGFSGALLDRPAIEEMLDLAERRAMDVVLATELSRLTRGDPSAFYVLRAELERCGVQLHFLDKTWSDDPDDETAPILEGLALGLARAERRRIARRIARGKQRVWEQGYHWSPTPAYGFVYHKGGHKAGHFAIREDEAVWVRAMYERAGAGWTLGEIGRWLQAQGAPTRKGGRWWPRTILGILRNVQNYGCFAGRTEAVRAVRPYQARPSSPAVGQRGSGRRQVKSSHRLLPRSSWRGERLRPELAIVSKEVWERAQEMRQRSAATNPRSKNPTLVAGLVTCTRHEDMPRKMYHCARSGRPPAWRCGYRDGPGGRGCYCGSYVRADVLDRAVWARLVDLATAPDAVLADMTKRLAAGAAQASKAQRRISTARAQVQKAEDALNRAAVAYYGGELEQDRYLHVQHTFEGQKKEALRALAAAEEEAARWAGQGLPAVLVDRDALVAAHVADSAGHTQQVVRALIHQALGDPQREALEALPLEEKRRRVRRLVEQITVDRDGVHLVCALGGHRLSVDYCDGAHLVSPLRVILSVPLGDPEPYRVRSVTVVGPARDAAHTVGGDAREKREVLP